MIKSILARLNKFAKNILNRLNIWNRNKNLPILIEVFVNNDKTCTLFAIRKYRYFYVDKNGNLGNKKYEPKTRREAIGMIKRYYKVINVEGVYLDKMYTKFLCERKNKK